MPHCLKVLLDYLLVKLHVLLPFLDVLLLSNVFRSRKFNHYRDVDHDAMELKMDCVVWQDKNDLIRRAVIIISRLHLATSITTAHMASISTDQQLLFDPEWLQLL